jgi:hypothetical protein
LKLGYDNIFFNLNLEETAGWRSHKIFEIGMFFEILVKEDAPLLFLDFCSLP